MVAVSIVRENGEVYTNMSDSFTLLSFAASICLQGTELAVTVVPRYGFINRKFGIAGHEAHACQGAWAGTRPCFFCLLLAFFCQGILVLDAIFLYRHTLTELVAPYD